MLIRENTASDTAFVFNSWLKSWRVNKYSGCIPNHLYYKVTTEAIENLISRGAKIKVACLDSDENTILGWVCYERLRDDEFCVHYIYVKDPYLKMGVGQRLAEELPQSGLYTHKCSQVADYFPTYKWIPEIARRK